MLAEPSQTNYDLNFRLFDVPVRVHPLFWLIGLLLGINGRDTEPREVIIWILAMFVSILVHEFGHAVMIRRYGWQPRITLYSLGGLASYGSEESYGSSWNPNEESARAKIIIAAAGPIAGFLFAAVVIGLLLVLQRDFYFQLGGPLGFSWYVGGLPSLNAHYLVHDLIFINIFWGIMNLLPVYPLDGGQIARELLSLKDPYQGVVKSLWLSVITAGTVAVASLLLLDLDFSSRLFLAILFGFLGYTSYAALRAVRGGEYGSYGQYGEEREW